MLVLVLRGVRELLLIGVLLLVLLRKRVAADVCISGRKVAIRSRCSAWRQRGRAASGKGVIANIRRRGVGKREGAAAPAEAEAVTHEPSSASIMGRKDQLMRWSIHVAASNRKCAAAAMCWRRRTSCSGRSKRTAGAIGCGETATSAAVLRAAPTVPAAANN